MISINDIIKIVSEKIIRDIREYCEENGIQDFVDYFRSTGSGSSWKGYFKSLGYDDTLFKEEVLDYIEERFPGNTFMTDDLDFVPDNGNAIPCKEWIRLVSKEVFA